MTVAMPHVASVNIGTVEPVEYRGRTETTAIFKNPTDEPVNVTIHEFGDDRQADRVAHGGPDRVAYAYAAEDLAWWAHQLHRDVTPGTMGENLTTSGIDVTNTLIGERWKIGTAIFEAAALRTPCFKLGIRMGIDAFSVQFTRARRPGAYLRVIQPGTVTKGDRIEIIARPDHGITMQLLADAYHQDPTLAARVLNAPQLSEHWRQWATSTAESQGGRGPAPA